MFRARFVSENKVHKTLILLELEVFLGPRNADRF